MRFDASPTAQELVKKTISIDPRMVRCGIVKLGSKLRDIVDAKGTVEWQRTKKNIYYDSALGSGSGV
jgi:small subunit ribosomal protein S6